MVLQSNVEKWLESADITASWEKLFTVIESPAVFCGTPDKVILCSYTYHVVSLVFPDHWLPFLLVNQIINDQYRKRQKFGVAIG